MCQIKDFEVALKDLAIGETNLAFWWCSEASLHKVDKLNKDLNPYFDITFEEVANDRVDIYEHFMNVYSQNPVEPIAPFLLFNKESVSEDDISNEMDRLESAFTRLRHINEEYPDFNITLYLEKYIPTKYKDNIIAWCNDGIEWIKGFSSIVRS